MRADSCCARPEASVFLWYGNEHRAAEVLHRPRVHVPRHQQMDEPQQLAPQVFGFGAGPTVQVELFYGPRKKCALFWHVC